VPSPDKQRPGCNFYDRCPKRMDVCKKVRPKLKEADRGIGFVFSVITAE
jgi:oligopeptide transport system ATP-binding protein